MQHSGITLLGLGPGDPAHLTLEAWQIIAGASEIWLRTRQHPTVAGFPDSANLYSFDDVYDQAADFETVYQTIIEQVLKLGRRLEGVIYAVPGHPFIAETTGPEIRRRAKADNIPVRVIQGLSFLEPLQTVLGLDPFPQTLLVDAFEIASSHQLPYSPHHPAIIAQIHNRSLAADLKLTLMTHFPDEHVVKLVHAAGTSQESVERLMLWQIDQSEKIGLLTALYVPALSPDSGLPALAEIVAQLRAPDGCPWDQEQTHESMRPHLIEEAYEVLDAIDHGDPAMLAEELGDLLFQVVFHAQLGSEDETFNLSDVISGIYRKLVHRHPHVFADTQIDTEQQLLENWERLKAEEKKGRQDTKGMLDGLSNQLPALSQSQGYQQRAARVGFDWPDVNGIFAKIAEELTEFKEAATSDERAAEMGDLLFATVRLADWYKIDAETALRAANQRFRTRFSYIEEQAKSQERPLTEMTLDEMNHHWEAAKRLASDSDSRP